MVSGNALSLKCLLLFNEYFLIKRFMNVSAAMQFLQKWKRTQQLSPTGHTVQRYLFTIVLQQTKKEKMKHLKRSICLPLVILVLFSLPGFSQISESSDSLKDELKIAAREIMSSARNCALITLDNEGNPGVRTMEPFLPEDDFTVWLGTSPKTRKVSQIKNNPNVTLYYVDIDGSGYVAMHGIAQLVNDQSEKEKRWKEQWKAYYKNKSDDYILIKVSPKWIEVISYSRGIVGESSTWDPPVIMFDSK